MWSLVAGGIAIFSATTPTTSDTADRATPPTTDQAASPSIVPGAGDPAIGDDPLPARRGLRRAHHDLRAGAADAASTPAKTYTATIATIRRATSSSSSTPTSAPKAVNNFVFLARYHYYDGVPFHRIVPGFVVQGGDPR